MRKLKKVADDLGVTKMTRWNWMRQGKIKFHKIALMTKHK